MLYEIAIRTPLRRLFTYESNRPLAQAKNVYQVHKVDARGKVNLQKVVSRQGLKALMQKIPTYWARDPE